MGDYTIFFKVSIVYSKNKSYCYSYLAGTSRSCDEPSRALSLVYDALVIPIRP